MDSAAFKDHVRSLMDAEPDPSDVLGVHGTSVEAIGILARDGCLPVTPASAGPERAGHLYLFCADQTLEGDERLVELQDLMREAWVYARQNAYRHAFASHLRLPEMPREVDEISFELQTSTSPQMRTHLWKQLVALGIDPAGDPEIVHQACRVYSGAVLAIRRSVLTEAELLQGDLGESDFRISMPRGLSIDHIAGIAVYGAADNTRLAELLG